MKCTVISTVVLGLLAGVAVASEPVSDPLRASYPLLEARRAERERAAAEERKPEKRVALKTPPKSSAPSSASTADSTSSAERKDKTVAPVAGSSTFDPNAALLSTLPMAPAALSARKNELKQEAKRNPSDASSSSNVASVAPTPATASTSPRSVPARESDLDAAATAAALGSEPLRVGTARTPVGTSQVTLAGPFGNVLMRTLMSGEKVQLMVQYPGFAWEIFTDVEFQSSFRLQQTEPRCARFSKPGDTENFYDICLDKSKLRVRAVGDVESLT